MRQTSFLPGAYARLLPGLLLFVAGLVATASAPNAAPAPPGNPGGDVPRVSLEVRAIGRAELDSICPVLEGRLLARKEPGDGFRFVSSAEPAEFHLLIEVADMTYSFSDDYEHAADADADPNHPKRTTSVGSELSVDITLSRPGAPESLYEDSLDFTSRRPLESPEERLRGLLLDDLMSRAAEKIPKVLHKRLRS